MTSATGNKGTTIAMNPAAKPKKTNGIKNIPQNTNPKILNGRVIRKAPAENNTASSLKKTHKTKRKNNIPISSIDLLQILFNKI